MFDKTTRCANVAALGAALSLAALATPAEAQSRTEVGMLECDVSGGIGLLIGSNRALSCVFNGSDGLVERYEGTISRAGIDVGVTGPGYIAWAVLAPTAGYPPGALAGAYGGVSAEASLGVGAGANALLGGSDRTITLQPVSVQAQTGFNFAAGITALELFAD